MSAAPVAAPVAAPSGPALDRLREEQRQIEDLFTRYFEHQRDPAFRPPEALRLATLIFTLLRVHDELESGVLQPALASRIGTHPALGDVAAQRADVSLAIDRIEALGASDAARNGAMHELAREVGEWFAASERSLYLLAHESGLNLARLDTELAARQEALLSSDSSDANGIAAEQGELQR